MNKFLRTIFCCIIFALAFSTKASNNSTENAPQDFNQETSSYVFDQAAQTLGNYLAIFAIVYGSTIMHELGHAIVDYSLTGNWPNIIIGEPDGPNHYNILDTDKFKLDISQHLSVNGKEFGSYPKTFFTYKDALIKATGKTMATLTDIESADIEVNACINQFGRAASFMTPFAGPLSGILSLIAIKKYLPNNIFAKLAWFNEISDNYFNLASKPKLDGYRAFHSLGIKSSTITDILLYIIFEVATLLYIETFVKNINEIWNKFDIKDLIKYWTLHHTIINKNTMGRIRAFSAFVALIALDYFNLIQKTSAAIKQHVPLLDSASNTIARTIDNYTPRNWDSPDIITSATNWIAAIGIYGLAHGMKNFNPLVH